MFLLKDSSVYPKAAFKEKEIRENPSFGIFGKRLYKDQSLQEFLNEFLLIMFSPKSCVGENYTFEQPFPSFEILTSESEPLISYASKARLNVKLLAFWGTSRLDARAIVHKEQHDALRDTLKERLDLYEGLSKETILQDIESLLLGFRSVGAGRTWCTQQFLPITKSFLTAETLWSESEAKRNKPTSWNGTLENISKYWSFNKYNYMARGGDVLYLQICLALSQPAKHIAEWNEQHGLGLTADEANPQWLHTQLQKYIPHIMSKQVGIESLVDFLESLETGTADFTDKNSDENMRYQKLAWCSAHSWQEGYLFALELLRIVQAQIDPTDRLSLLETLCAMQVIRTLCMRTAAASAEQATMWPHYILGISNVDEERRSSTRALSHRAFKTMQRIMYTHILSVGEESNLEKKKIEKVAQESGNGLFAKIAKELGLVIPRTGGTERFVLPERILRLFIITLVPAGKSMRLDTFKELIQKRYGFVFDAEGFDMASQWISGVPAYLSGNCDAWLQNMLENAHCLVRLSDSCSLVRNATQNISDEEE